MRHSEYTANLALSSRAVARAAVPTPAEIERHANRTARRESRAWRVVALASIAAVVYFVILPVVGF